MLISKQYKSRLATTTTTTTAAAWAAWAAVATDADACSRQLDRWGDPQGGGGEQRNLWRGRCHVTSLTITH